MRLSLSVLILFSLIAVACKPTHEPSAANMVTVSIAPQKYFVDAISGKQIEVSVFVPAGSSPDSYEPNPKRMTDLQKSKAFIQMGNFGFEMAWMPKIKDQFKTLKVFNANEGINFLSDEEHGQNPHIWMSAKQSKIMANNIYKALLECFPEKKDLFAQNMKLLETELDSLDLLFAHTLDSVSHRTFLIFHPALDYMAADYGLVQLAIEEHGKEPSPNHLMHISEESKNLNIKLILIQKEFDVENAQVIAKQIGANVVQINPLNENWKAEQLEILKILYENLK
jgi:zinc transport system substrate-binding protein